MKLIPVSFIVSVALLVAACGKDKFETKPRLEIKDYNTKEVGPGTTLRIRLNFFDKEGDLNQAPFTAIIRRQNQLPLDPTQDKTDTLFYTLPDFPPKDNGEINYTLEYGFLKESTVENDTIHIRFSVADKKGNLSDTVVSDQLVILLP